MILVASKPRDTILMVIIIVSERIMTDLIFASTTYLYILEATVKTPTSSWSYDICWRYPFKTSTYYQYTQHVQLHRLLTITTPATTTTSFTPATFTTIS